MTDPAARPASAQAVRPGALLALPLGRRTLARGALLAVLAGGLSACGGGGDTVAEQARSGDQKGYVAGDGALEQLAPGQRREPVALAGTTLDGRAWSLGDAQGQVVVLNKWGSWCPPCVEEADDIQQVHERYKGKGVTVMGLDERDSVETAAAFMRERRLTYPSLADDGGKAVLGLQGQAAATPTTIVLDRQHRIAAVVKGPVTASTLAGLVDDVLAEPQ